MKELIRQWSYTYETVMKRYFNVANFLSARISLCQAGHSAMYCLARFSAFLKIEQLYIVLLGNIDLHIIWIHVLEMLGISLNPERDFKN